MNKYDVSSSGNLRNHHSILKDHSISVRKRLERNSHPQLLSQDPSYRNFILGGTVNKAHGFLPHSSHGSLEPCKSRVKWMEGDSEGQSRGKRVLSHSLHSPQIHPGDAGVRVARPQSWESRGHGCFVYYHDSFTW